MSGMKNWRGHVAINTGNTSVKIKTHRIYPNGVVDSREVEREELTLDYMSKVVRGSPEWAAVLFNGQPATLIVDETGAFPPYKPPNTRATSIYWTATVIGRTGQPFEPLKMSMIHGDVLLVEIDKRQL